MRATNQQLGTEVGRRASASRGPDGFKRAGLEDTALFFLEGWARYAEGLADELGLYSSDLDRLALSAQLSTGLVVECGDARADGELRRR